MQKRFFSLYFINKMWQWHRIWDSEDGKKAPKAPTAWFLGENVALKVRHNQVHLSKFAICHFST